MSRRRAIAEFAMYWCLLFGGAAGVVGLWMLTRLEMGPNPTVVPVLSTIGFAALLLSVGVFLRVRLGRPVSTANQRD